MQWAVREASKLARLRVIGLSTVHTVYRYMSYNLCTSLQLVADTLVRSFELVKSFQVYHQAIKLEENGFRGWKNHAARCKTAMHRVLEVLGCNKSARHCRVVRHSYQGITVQYFCQLLDEPHHILVKQ